MIQAQAVAVTRTMTMPVTTMIDIHATSAKPCERSKKLKGPQKMAGVVLLSDYNYQLNSVKKS